MQIVIGNVLSTEELRRVRAALARARFVDGTATAGFAARLVKNNRQAEASDRSLGTIRKLIAERVLANEVFRLAVRPKALSPLLFSRYEKGMRYGSHVDDALMDGMRTDVSFTLFLSEPESYDGGELAIEGVSGEETFKLDAGALIAYSATSLHHVREVTRGARLAAVDVAVRRGAGTRRLTASGRDIYAVTAPIVVEGVVRLLGDQHAVGAVAPGEAFDAADVLAALAAHPAGLTLDTARVRVTAT